MPHETVIRGEPPRVQADPWQIIGEGIEALPRGAIAVPLALWQAQREALLARTEPVGAWLAPGDDPALLGRDVFALSLVAVHFPKSADGRGYSTAVLLRRMGYRGELRAFGDIGRDHLLSLRRCGFDAFRLPPGRDPQAALAAFDEFSVHYQGSVADPLPLFRRRAAAGAS